MVLWLSYGSATVFQMSFIQDAPKSLQEGLEKWVSYYWHRLNLNVATLLRIIDEFADDKAGLPEFCAISFVSAPQWLLLARLNVTQHLQKKYLWL
jgi:hypothetical protein